MNYEFPKDIKIDEVRELIKDSEDFFEAARGDHIIFNYMTCFTNTFPEIKSRGDAILRELRGIIFSSDGKVISRPLHKFFNMGEKSETNKHNINWNSPYETINKVDGSMVRPVILDNELIWATKMGKTFISEDIETWMDLPENAGKKLNLETLAYAMIYQDKTPIFEVTYLNNRIVLLYDKMDLHLIAIRDNITGEYTSRKELEDISNDLDITLVDKVDVFDINSDINKNYGKIEGIVLSFENGHKIKVKTEWYIKLHRIKSKFSVERNLVDIILSGDVDDLISTFDDDNKALIKKYEQELQKMISSLVIMLEVIRFGIKHGVIKDKKNYALKQMPHNPKIISSIIFSTWDSQKENDRVLVINKIKENIISNNRFERLKNNLKWNLPEINEKL